MKRPRGVGGWAKTRSRHGYGPENQGLRVAFGPFRRLLGSQNSLHSSAKAITLTQSARKFASMSVHDGSLVNTTPKFLGLRALFVPSSSITGPHGAVLTASRADSELPTGHDAANDLIRRPHTLEFAPSWRGYGRTFRFSAIQNPNVFGTSSPKRCQWHFFDDARRSTKARSPRHFPVIVRPSSVGFPEFGPQRDHTSRGPMVCMSLGSLRSC